MKSLFTLAFFVATLAHNPAFGKTINKVVQDLSPYIYGVEVHEVEGKTAEKMLEDLALRIKGVDEESYELINYPENGIPGADEASGQYGLATVADVGNTIISMYTFFDQERELTKAQENEIFSTLKELKAEGALLGYTTEGGGVCGVSFPSVLVLDKKKQKIYELVLVGGSC